VHWEGCGREGSWSDLITALSGHMSERDEENHAKSLSEQSVAKTILTGSLSYNEGI